MQSHVRYMFFVYSINIHFIADFLQTCIVFSVSFFYGGWCQISYESRYQITKMRAAVFLLIFCEQVRGPQSRSTEFAVSTQNRSENPNCER